MIFVDSSFWIAQLMQRDGRHRDAVRLGGLHAGQPLLTSNMILGETWTFSCRRAGHRTATAWLDRVLVADEVSIETVTPDLEADAWEWLRVHDERPYSFVDATSFTLMRRRGLTEALAFGGDFAAAGFLELSA
ncbi:MAG: type II toxin-antitoxin system VapC family toxin [Gaiella sp.]